MACPDDVTVAAWLGGHIDGAARPSLELRAQRPARDRDPRALPRVPREARASGSPRHRRHAREPRDALAAAGRCGDAIVELDRAVAGYAVKLPADRRLVGHALAGKARCLATRGDRAGAKAALDRAGAIAEKAQAVTSLRRASAPSGP